MTKTAPTRRPPLRVVEATPDVPAHLTALTKEWYLGVVEEYQLDPHHLKLLQAAAECWDEYQQCRELLTRDGLVISTGQGGMKPHPAATIARHARIGFARLIREMDLDCAEPSSSKYRPPALRSNRRL
jgi:P27 family predicted phage terminase small subunit